MESSPQSSDLRLGISVVICCYNSAARLPETLRHLVCQKIVSPIEWEVIVIDNASTDGTADVARANWPDNISAPLRVIREERPGVRHARERGIVEASYDVVSYIDDDNWVSPDWIQRSRAIFDERLDVAACGSRSEPVPEVTPPPWFEQLLGNYAANAPFDLSGDITDKGGSLLWSAGLNLRTAAVRNLFLSGFSFLTAGRIGNGLGAGEDSELCYALREAGWRLFYDDQLEIRHFIPRARLTWAYALKLLEGMGQASAVLDLYAIALRRTPFTHHPAWKRTWLFQYLKLQRQRFILMARHRKECIEKLEGSRYALQYVSIMGALAVLRSWKGKYGEMQVSVVRTMSALRRAP